MKANKELAKRLYDKLLHEEVEQVIVFGEKVWGLNLTKAEKDFLSEPFELSYSIKNKGFEHKSKSRVHGEFVEYADGSIYMVLRNVNIVIHTLYFLQEIIVAYEAQEIIEEEHEE